MVVGNSAAQESTRLYTGNKPAPLTCTSTGGPATTVAWTRGDDTLISNLDYTISSQVTETETAVYVHTLRVTGRQEGSYSCSVSNSRTSPAHVSTLQVAGRKTGISHVWKHIRVNYFKFIALHFHCMLPLHFSLPLHSTLAFSDFRIPCI